MGARSRLVALAAATLTLGLAPSCYFEGTIAYHPRISQAVTSGGPATVATDDGGGWSAGANIGFYLDVQVPTRRFRGFGVGLSPSGFNGYGIVPSDGVAQVATKSLGLRADVILPTHLLAPYFHQRVTVIYDWLSDLSTTLPPATESTPTTAAHGRMWFLGGSLGYRLHVREGARRGHILLMLSAGGAVHVSSTGLGARFLIVPAMLGSPPSRGPYDATSGSSGEPRPSNSCYYSDECDAYGHCTSTYKCM